MDEITEEMIEAGVAVLIELEDDVTRSYIVREVYAAMRAVYEAQRAAVLDAVFEPSKSEA